MNLRAPTDWEWKLVARCMLEQHVLFGSFEEIWASPLTWRALGTWRECIDAISLLIGGSHSVKASFVKSCVMQADGISEAPYMLDEVAEFLVEDSEARVYWQAMCADDRFPHRCPHCGAAAYVGFLQVECKAACPRGR